MTAIMQPAVELPRIRIYRDPVGVLSQWVENRLGEHFRCWPDGDRVSIETPFLYPNAEPLQVYYLGVEGYGCFSDLGDALRWVGWPLSAQERTQAQNDAIYESCCSAGARYVETAIRVDYDATKDPDVANAVFRVIQAALSLSAIGHQASRKV